MTTDLTNVGHSRLGNLLGGLINGIAILVQAHQDCQRHDLSYRHWNWEFQNGSAIEDQGFRATAT